MKTRHITPILALATLVFSGCSLNPDADGRKQISLMGVFEYEQDSHQPISPTTLAISSDEVSPQKEYSGDRLTLLWGLITLKDY
ncbi:MAG: Uncharacterised protein [Opitutia bacterium UBA7350]|nr:MAG: Uncharacterised protein [Opitutae bacterium UBA7350]